jgi:glycosyltransferase involved in cell wall biosynthesis
VIVPDRLSDLVAKGEITPRYYNPGDLFDEVHILMTNDDKPDLVAIQKTVGSAKLSIHNLPLPSVIFSFGWQPFMLKKWVASGVQIARKIQPSLIRAHGNYFNGFLAANIKQQLKVPLVISLHINPDIDVRGSISWRSNLPAYFFYKRMIFFENVSLKNADMVLPVYESIRSYAIEHGANQVKVCYNVLNPDFLCQKKSYTLHSPPRIISVGRQLPGKNPENLVRALSLLPDAELTLVGDGSYHNHLKQVAKDNNVEDRVIFHRAIPNDELCQLLPEYDIFATHTDYWEISKSVLEPLLTGMPVVLNRRCGAPVHELDGDFIYLVDNIPTGYATALTKLLENHTLREQFGRKAYSHAQALWSPTKTEAEYVEVYRSLLASRCNSHAIK